MFRSRHSASMDKNHPEKSVSFSNSSRGEEPKSSSLSSTSDSTTTTIDPSLLPTDNSSDDRKSDAYPETILEEENLPLDDNSSFDNSNARSSSSDFDNNLFKLSEEVDQFLATLDVDNDDDDDKKPPEIPDSVEKFVKFVQVEVVKCVSGDVSSKLFYEPEEEPEITLFDSVDKISKLNNALGQFTSEKEIASLVNFTSTVVQRAMTFLEEEFRSLLDIPRSSNTDSSDFKSKRSDRASNADSNDFKSKRISNHSFNDPDRCPLPPPQQQLGENSEEEDFPGYSMETVMNLKKLAAAMISSGYEAECCQVYSFVRRNAIEESLNKVGFEKISIDDVQKMQWESLEGEIVTWIKVIKQCVNVYFPGERKLSEQVFSENPSVSSVIFNNLSRNVVLQLLNFAEAVGMTKRSAEKLFKFLDMYETLRDLNPTIDELFSGDTTHQMRAETQSARSRLGEAAVMIFCDLENSIKSDAGKTPVPGGAVHPLTSYTVNYINYACEYKDTFEQIFQEHRNILADDTSAPESESDANSADNNDNQQVQQSPFVEQLITVMDLLDSNLEAKSKLYKDLSLSYIFLMNNGRYIMQKIKRSPDIYHLLGSTWSRKRSSDLRQYHKNYQRETWSKVLGCLKDDGLQVNGKVQKPVLKERFKSFNAMFDEIHKTQSTWIVNDEQLQSELQVSISAVIIPAYRSFLGRFRHCLDAGRQAEKYIKFGPEDIESCIDQLFDGMKRKT
ncbi:Exocyst complex component exo70b1 [Thalictrum thalictroides]|uniref:Exocyst subunit Exo70 family protein n=1 Tax=Thalictrum thalictroides TaxID=46969 RepID=A0A7J6VDN0_THATH|nr:Exocyst complex component exo70b1 [Thalictrum thalictroides]